MEGALKANPVAVTATEPWVFNLCQSHYLLLVFFPDY
jgi:hypothetical protein